MLEIKNLVKSYGDNKVLKNVSFTCSRGQIISLTGNNGSGKTTTFRIILDLLEADEGEVSYNHRHIPYRLIGYLPEDRSMFYDCSVENQLRLFGRLKGMKDSELNARLEYWFNITSTQQYRKMLPIRLSKGNQQKIQLIIAFLHDPEIVIMDEPWSGLDQDNAELFSRIIQLQKAKGKIILLSSHLHQEVLGICDRFLFLKDGIISIDTDRKQLQKDERSVVEFESDQQRRINDDSIICKKENNRTVKLIVRSNSDAFRIADELKNWNADLITVRKMNIRDYAEVENAGVD